MIKVTLTQYKHASVGDTVTTMNSVVESVIEGVTVIDMDEGFLRLITGDGEMLKIALRLVAGYTAEVI